MALVLSVILFAVFMLIISRERNHSISLLLLIGFFFRLFLMFADYYQLFPIFGSGADSEKFHICAMRNMNTMGFDYRITAYSDVLTVVYRLTNGSRLFAQFLNVLMGSGVMVVVNKTLKVVNSSIKVRKRIIMIMAFMPMLGCFSAILLREAWIEFFISLSMYFFVCWFLNVGNQLKNMIGLLTCGLLATWMHSGCVAVIVGYLFAILSYNPKKQAVKFSSASVFGILVLFSFLAFFSAFQDVLGERFSSIEEDGIEETLVDRYSSSQSGGSRYLEWLTVTNPLQAILFSPLKIFYFLFSPIPLDWRGFSDVVAFMMDSIIYIGVFWILIRRKLSVRVGKLLKRYLIVVFLLISFVFSFGTSYAGTAIRHRAKAFSVLSIALAVSLENSGKKKTTRLLRNA